MHILVLVDHPNPSSFTHAIAHRFCDGAKLAGHTVEIADLHAEGFDPKWSMSDVDSEDAMQTAGDIAAEQARISRADAICLVFPLFWWGMPTMSKGWIDRVWCWGWAYDHLDAPEVSLQPARRLLLLVPAGANSVEIREKGYQAAMETLWIKGTFGYFGFSERKLELLCGSTGSEGRRRGLLQRAFECGRDFPTCASPDVGSHR